MKIVLKPEEKIEIEFADSDGNIIVEFNADSIRVKSDWPDSENRVGIIYEEIFISPEEFFQ